MIISAPIFFPTQSHRVIVYKVVHKQKNTLEIKRYFLNDKIYSIHFITWTIFFLL